MLEVSVQVRKCVVSKINFMYPLVNRRIPHQHCMLLGSILNLCIFCCCCNAHKCTFQLLRIYWLLYILLFAQSELKKSLVEHLVQLLSCGHVLPVVDCVAHCMEMESLDQSHIRHFVAEVWHVLSTSSLLQSIYSLLSLLFGWVVHYNTKLRVVYLEFLF